MKKIIYLFIAIISLTSCSNNDDDDSTSPSIDLIVGKWEIVSQTMDGEVESPDCDENDILEVFENGTYTLDAYEAISPGTCIEEKYEGLWTNTESGYYFNNTPNGPLSSIGVFSSNNTVVSFTVEETILGESYTIVITLNKI